MEPVPIPIELKEQLVAQANGDVDVLTNLFLAHGVYRDEGEAALAASVWITGVGDVLPPGYPDD